MSLQLTATEFNQQVTDLTRSCNATRTGVGWKVGQAASPLKGTQLWMHGHGSVALSSSCSDIIGILFFVWYSVEDCLPQMGMTPLSGDSTHLQEAFPRLHFLNIADIQEEGVTRTAHAPQDVGQQLLVSHTTVEALGRSLWVVHSCDTVSVLNCAIADGDAGDMLHLFLRAMAPFVRLPVEMVPVA